MYPAVMIASRCDLAFAGMHTHSHMWQEIIDCDQMLVACTLVCVHMRVCVSYEVCVVA